MKVTIATLNGYLNWNVSAAKTVEVEGDVLTPDNGLTALVKADIISQEEVDGGITLNDLCFDGVPKTNGNVITCMGEESGYVLVGH